MLQRQQDQEEVSEGPDFEEDEDGNCVIRITPKPVLPIKLKSSAASASGYACAEHQLFTTWHNCLATTTCRSIVDESKFLSPPVLKIEFGPPHTKFGSVWSPKKRVIFGTFNKRQISVFCVFTPNYSSNKLLMLYSCVHITFFVL